MTLTFAPIDFCHQSSSISFSHCLSSPSTKRNVPSITPWLYVCEWFVIPRWWLGYISWRNKIVHNTVTPNVDQKVSQIFLRSSKAKSLLPCIYLHYPKIEIEFKSFTISLRYLNSIVIFETKKPFNSWKERSLYLNQHFLF